MHRPPSHSKVHNTQVSPTRGKAANEVLGNKSKVAPDKDQLSLTGHTISPRAPLPSPRRNSISTASPTSNFTDPHITITNIHVTTHNTYATNNIHDDKLRNLHGRATTRNNSSGHMSKYTKIDSPVSRIPSFQDNLHGISTTPSHCKLSSPALVHMPSGKSPMESPDFLYSPSSNASLELHETPTNYSLEEEGNNTFESRNEDDFASFLHKDAIQERYLTPTPNRKSRYDDLQLSLDKEPPSTPQILRPVADEIPEDIEVHESIDKLDSDLGITPRRLHDDRTPSVDANLVPSRTPSKSGRSSFNVQEFKKSLQTFNKEHNLPQKNNTNNNNHIYRQASPNTTAMVKYKHAACIIQRWWRQIKKNQSHKRETILKRQRNLQLQMQQDELELKQKLSANRAKLFSSGMEHRDLPPTSTGVQRPGSTPSQRPLQYQPLPHINSDISYKFQRASRPDKACPPPLKIPTSSSEVMSQPSSISPTNERLANNHTPTFEIHNPRRVLSQSEGVEAHSNNADLISPRPPHSSSPPTPNADSTSPRSTSGSGSEGSGKLRTATSSMDIFVDEDDNKSKTPRMEVRVERNVLMLDCIAEEEDNIVVNDDELQAQKQKQLLKLQQEKLEEEVESGSGTDSNANSPYLEDVIDTRCSAIEGARMLGQEIGNYMELQRTLLAKEQQESKRSKRKRLHDPKMPFQIPLIHSRSPFSSPLVHMQHSPSPSASPHEPTLSVHLVPKYRPPYGLDGYDGDVGEEIVEIPDVADLADIEEIEEFAETTPADDSFSSPHMELSPNNCNERISKMKDATPQPHVSPSRPSPQPRVMRELSPPTTPTVLAFHTPPMVPRTPYTVTPGSTAPRATTPRATTPRDTTPRSSPPDTPSTPGSAHRVRTVHNVPPLDLQSMGTPTKKPQQSPHNLTQHAYQNMPRSLNQNAPDPYDWDELLEVESISLPSPTSPRKELSQDNPKPQLYQYSQPSSASQKLPLSQKQPTPQKPSTPQHTSRVYLQTPNTPHTPQPQMSLQQPPSQRQYTPTKYASQVESKLFNFLDFLEQQDDSSSCSFITDYVLPSPDRTVHSSNNTVVGNVKARIVALEVEIDDKVKTIEIMKNTIKQMRAKEQEALAESEQKCKDQMAAKQQEQQEVLQRHLKFIDRLMADKKELSEKCDTLSSELQDSDKRMSDKLKEVSEQHNRELKKHKDSWTAAEKIRRDAWMQDKTKEIKELTIKGLEPEIHKLLAKQKQESKVIDEAHQQELKKTKEEMAAAYDAQLQQWKLKLLREHKDDIEKEREKSKSLMKENSESVQDMLQQQARQLAQDFREEKQKFEDAHRTEKLAYEDKIMRMKNNEELMRSKMQDHIESNYQDLIRKHQTEISVLKEKAEIERDQWMSRTMAKLQQDARQHEEELRAKLMMERDEEIELVIARFEEESTAAQNQANRMNEEKTNKLRDKHSTQLREIKESEKIWKTKYLDVVKTATEKGDTITDLKAKINLLEATIAQKDDRNHKTEDKSKDLKLKLEHLETAIEQQKATIAKEYNHEIARIQAELEQSRSSYTSLANSFHSEKAELVKTKNTEMEQLHGRIKAAIAKKDETIQTLKDRLQTSELKAKHLQINLDNQRKELLG